MTRSSLRVGAVAAALTAVAGCAAADSRPADGVAPAAARLSAQSGAQAPTEEDEIMVQLVAELGEPRHFCLDVPGYPSSGNIDNHREAAWPLEAHTCKTGLPESGTITLDQRISRSALTEDPGKVLYTRLDACLEVVAIGQTAVREDALSVVEDCTGAAAQQVSMTGSGKIKTALDSSMCLTIGKEAFEAGDREPGEPWYRRALTFSTCTKADAARQTWKITAAPASS
ncbi:hypothetical protein ACIQAC_06200 [Streptomyces sp. NPDC088387]|uniref:hypothetical protein n=1 Tax=Streptomyces sp. NPDC088387 TaxID=3365859 RepID=UPI00381D0C4F